MGRKPYITDYTDRCGGCKFWKPSYKYGVPIKMGTCHRRFMTSKHGASDKKCQGYIEKGEQE